MADPFDVFCFLSVSWLRAASMLDKHFFPCNTSIVCLCVMPSSLMDINKNINFLLVNHVHSEDSRILQKKCPHELNFRDILRTQPHCSRSRKDPWHCKYICGQFINKLLQSLLPFGHLPWCACSLYPSCKF